jgi:hypothetical protein
MCVLIKTQISGAHLETNICTYFSPKSIQGRVMAQAGSRRSLTADARVCVLVNPCGICGGQNDTGTDSSPSSSGFSCQYHSTVALQLISSGGWGICPLVTAIQRRSLTPSKSINQKYSTSHIFWHYRFVWELSRVKFITNSFSLYRRMLSQHATFNWVLSPHLTLFSLSNWESDIK